MEAAHWILDRTDQRTIAVKPLADVQAAPRPLADLTVKIYADGADEVGI